MIRVTVVVGALPLALAACGAEELPAAANGTDLAACADGADRVLVLNDQELTVVAVPGDRGVLRVGG